MLKVGVTGGIGSGKTTVCELFELLGVPIFYSDTVSKDILAKDDSAKQAVIDRFGEAAYNPEGPDRVFLASVVFKDENALADLNAILHPKVAERFQHWYGGQNAPYVIKEAAILFEVGANKGLDAVVVVSAPDELRIERVMQRDGASREAVLERLQRQMPQEEKILLADHEVVNDGAHSLIEQVNALHKLFEQPAG